MKRFVQADRNQPMLLPPDLREWVSLVALAYNVKRLHVLKAAA